MAQRLFHYGKSVVVLAGFDLDQPGRRYTGAGKAGREQVGLGHDPENIAFRRSGRDARSEEGGGGVIAQRAGVAGNLVQRGAHQPACCQAVIDGGNTEGQARHIGPRNRRYSLDFGNKGLQPFRARDSRHDG